MSALANEYKAVNLGQGFPDFQVPERLIEALDRAMREGKNQYAHMAGIPALRGAIAAIRALDPAPEIRRQFEQWHAAMFASGAVTV